jgi:phospholipase C
VPPNPDAGGPFTPTIAKMPLTPPALSLMGMLAAKFGLPTDVKPTSFGEAYEMLQRLGRGLFGS